MATNLQNLGANPTFRTVSFLGMASRAWGGEWSAPDHGIYEFAKGRKFDSTDRGLTGIYGVAGNNLLLLDGADYPDMRDGLHVGVGTKLGAAQGGFGSHMEIDYDPRV